MVQGIGEAFGVMIWAMFLGGILIMGALATLALAILKWCGVLLLSWWWVLGIVPGILAVALIIFILVVGIKTVFGR